MRAESVRRLRRQRSLPGGLGLLGILLAACFVGLFTPGAAGSATRAATPALHVVPFPNTPDASPQSQIIFSSLRLAELSAPPQVTGSVSGAHPGHLTALPDQAGTAFAPTKPFTPGEIVRVRASLTSPQAGTASGDPGATTLTFSFTVAAPAVSAAAELTWHRSLAGAPSAQASPFHSAPHLDPPRVHVNIGPAPGGSDIFLSPSGQPRGMMILNRRGQLIWFRPLHGLLPANLEAQRYHGQPVLTWWQGTIQNGHGITGQDMILSRSYQTVASVQPGWGYVADQHDFRITPRGTALVDAYPVVRANLSSVGGPASGALADCLVQEVDIRTGRVLWDWHAWGHVPLSSSQLRAGPSGVYDPFHLNSIQQLPGHRLLLSFRNTWAVYEVNQLTGRIIWTLGGKRSSFTMGPGSRFEWQHDARLYDHGLLTVFDDAASPQEEPQSSAKELRIDLAAHRVTLIHAYRHSPPLLAGSQGSAQVLANQDVFVGWGSEPNFSEYAPGGRQVFDASFQLGNVSYRAYRFAWAGQPATRPAVALSRSASGITWVYVSWNGATQVATWRILGGVHPHRLSAVKTAPWRGFETSISLPHAPRYLAVQALDAQGRPLGRSRTLTRP